MATIAPPTTRKEPRGKSGQRNGETYEEWVARVEQRPSSTKKAGKRKAANKAREAEAKAEYDAWLLKKSHHDRGIELLSQISKQRGSAEEDWMAVAVAMAAINVSLGNMKNNKLFTAFRDWSRDNHMFEKIKISEAAGQKYSGRARALWDLDETDHTYLLESVPFTHASEKLTKDNIQYNKLFTKLVKQSWNKALAEARRRMAARDPTGTKDMAGGEEEGKGADGGAEAQPPPTARSGGGGDLATTVVPELSRADRSVLYKMGLLQLRKWVEQDEEAIKTAERESRADKEQEAKRRHEAWASMKDKRRIRVPTTVADPNAKPMQKWKPPRFDFTGGNKKLVRPKRQQLAHNTLQMLANSGLNSKYIHATGRGTRDLESCRQSLLQQGFVAKANFTDPDGDYDEEQLAAFRREKEAIQKKKEEEAKAAEAKQANYELWAERKRLRDRAVDCLQYIPLADLSSELNKKMAWLNVGKALKGVDPTLMGDWAKWAGVVPKYSFNTCAVEWDSFDPIACDTHATSSAVKDTLLKLLHKKQVNYRAIWEEYVEDQERLAEMRGVAGFDVRGGLGPKRFRGLMKRAGMLLKDHEVQHVLKLFDTNGDGRVTIDEFLDFVGEERSTLGDAAEALGKACLWDKACHVCGMPAAYDNIVDKAASAPGKLVFTRKSLPDHELKARQRFHDEYDEPEGKRPCPMAQWTDAQRREQLRVLEDMAAPLREAAKAEAELLAGEKPLQPIVARTLEAESGNVLDLCTSITITWEEAKGSEDVFFYVLETQGAEGSLQHSKGEWKQLCVDPPNAQVDQPVGRFTVTDLKPNLTYQYRVRAFNASGGSPYVFKVFTTLPETPPAPVVVKAGPTVVSVTWRPDKEFKRRVAQLRNLYERIDANHDGVSRDELQAAVKGNRQLAEFLSRVSGSVASVFDMIETDDDGKLTWEEFRTFFQSQGALHSKSVAGSAIAGEDGGAASVHGSHRSRRSGAGSVAGRSATGRSVTGRSVTGRSATGRSATGRSATGRSVSGRSTGGGGAAGGGSRGRRGRKLKPVEPPTYILERCIADAGDDGGASKSEEAGEWEKVYEGRHTSRQIPALRPGTSYKIRVRVKSAEGIVGPPGPSAVINTALQIPDPPRVQGDVLPDRVTLRWTPARNTRFVPNQNADNDIMSKWVGFNPPNFSSDDGGIGVNLRKAFDYYDKNKNNTIDHMEFESLMTDLGQKMTTERLAEAFDVLDKNRDGAINFAEFCDWWKAGEVTYVLKGNDGVAVRAAPRSGKGSASASSSKPPVPSGSRSVRSRRSTGKREERNAGAGGGAGAGAGAGAGGDTGSVAGFAPGHEGIAATKLYMRGKAVRFTATDLKPNRCYTFFLRHVSARATSELSPPLHVITPPVKPYMPVVVRTKPRAVTLRWYPGQVGDFRYVLESWLVEELPGDTRSLGAWRRKQEKQLASADAIEWRKAYEGKETLATVSGLCPNSVYRFRVRAVNAAGVCSDDSGYTQATTCEVKEYEAPSPANCELHMTVDCSDGDVVVGDMVMFTEPVYILLNNDPTDYAKRDEFPPETTADKGQFLEDRTICAIVVAEKYKTAGSTARAMRASTQRPMTPGSGAMSVVAMSLDGMSVTSSVRRGREGRKMLGLSVLWCKATGPPYQLKPAARIWRKKSQLLSFGLLRSEWVQDDQRFSAEAERRARQGLQ